MPENMSSNKMNKEEVDGKYLRSGKTMQSLKWFFYCSLFEHVKNSIGQMKCLEKLSHASETFLARFCRFHKNMHSG